MKLDVLITPEAERNLTAAFQYIYSRSQQNAVTWLQGAYQTIAALGSFPLRCGARAAISP